MNTNTTHEHIFSGEEVIRVYESPYKHLYYITKKTKHTITCFDGYNHSIKLNKKGIGKTFDIYYSKNSIGKILDVYLLDFDKTIVVANYQYLLLNCELTCTLEENRQFITMKLMDVITKQCIPMSFLSSELFHYKHFLRDADFVKMEIGFGINLSYLQPFLKNPSIEPISREGLNDCLRYNHSNLELLDVKNY